MKISAISQNQDNSSRRNLFIEYSNMFASAIDVTKKANEANPKDIGFKNKKMGIENLEEFTIFPKQVIDGKTIITA